MQRRIIDAIMGWVLRLKIPIILGSLFILFAFGHLGRSLETESSASINNILPGDHPVITANQEFERLFGSNEGVVIALETDAVYENSFLQFLIYLCDQLETLEGVRQIYSIAATITRISGRGDELITGRFVNPEDLPYTEEQLRAMKADLPSHPFLRNRFVDRAGRATLIFVRLDAEAATPDAEKQQIAALIEKTTLAAIAAETQRTSLAITPHFVGDSVVGREIGRIQKQEDYIKSVMLIVLVVILLVSFRTFHGVFIPLLIAMTTMSFIMGLKALFRSTFSTIDPMLYALIFTISIGDSIHVIATWYGREYEAIGDRRERITRVMQHVLVPCLLTSITTAVGFSAVATSTIPELRKFGIFAAIAVVFAFVLTIALAPALLTLPGWRSAFKRSSGQETASSKGRRPLQDAGTALAHTLARITYLHARPICISFAMVGVVSIIGILQIRMGTDPYSFLRDSNPVNVALRFVEREMCGIQDLEVMLESRRGDEPFKDPALLREAEAFQNYVEALSGVTDGNSILTFLRLLNKAMHGNDAAYEAIPETRALTAQYVLLYEISGDVEDLGDWVSFEYDKMRMSFKVDNDADFAHIERRMEEFARERELPFTHAIAGSAVLWNRADGVFLRSQVVSLLLAMSVISSILFFVFRSLRYGMLSLVVNFFPILVGLGYLGFSGIGLNMGTVMIAPIAIGIAVDDTIHFLTRYRAVARPDKELQTTLHEVFRTVTKPIIFTSVVLAVGFGSNTISAFKPNGYFGMVSAITLIVAMFTDLLLLPAMISLWKGSRRP